MSEDIRRRPLGVFDRTNQIVDVLPRVLDEILPEDAHKRCSGKLWIAITRLKDMKGYMVSEFETRKDLIDVSITSSAAPTTTTKATLPSVCCYIIYATTYCE